MKNKKTKMKRNIRKTTNLMSRKQKKKKNNIFIIQIEIHGHIVHKPISYMLVIVVVRYYYECDITFFFSLLTNARTFILNIFSIVNLYLIVVFFFFSAHIRSKAGDRNQWIRINCCLAFLFDELLAVDHLFYIMDILKTIHHSYVVVNFENYPCEIDKKIPK